MISVRLDAVDKIAIYINGLIPKILAAALIIGPLTIPFTGGFAALKDLQFDVKTIGEAQGYITAVLETDSYIDDYMVLEYQYSFPIGLETFYGISYSHEYEFGIDEKVPVEYFPNNPNTSRISRTSLSKNGGGAHVGLTLFIIGLLGIPYRLWAIWRVQRLLSNSNLTLAEFKSIESTGVEVNDDEQFELTYRYVVNGEGFLKYYKTTSPDGLEEDVYLLYNVENPSRNLLIFQLPDRVSKKVLDAHRENHD